MARKITDAERVVAYFQAGIGTPEADTVFNIVRGMYRTWAQAASAKPPRKRRAPSEPPPDAS